MTVNPLVTKDGLLQQQPVSEEMKLRGNLHLDTYYITATNDIVIWPGGTGALRADNTGDARGDNANDLQRTRALTSQVASGNDSTICGGISNTVIAVASAIVGGTLNIIGNDSDYSTIAGGYDNSIGEGSTLCSYGFIGGGTNNIIEDIADYANIGGGKDNLVKGTYSVVCGGLDNEIRFNLSVICGGSDNIVAASRCFIGGGDDNLIQSNDSAIVGGRYNQITTPATFSFVGGGNTNVLSGNYDVLCGGSTNAVGTGDYATLVGGLSNAVTGSYSFVGGGTINQVTANYAGILCGNRGIAEHYGEQAHASGQFAATGDAQYMNLVARIITTTATPAILYLNGVTATERITLGASTSWYFTVKVLARQVNGDFTVNGWHFEGLATRDAGNISILNVSTVHSFINDATWACSLSADTSNQALQINVTGAASNTIHWVAKVELIKASG